MDLDDDTDGPDAETTDLDNDEDRTITTSITIYVIGAGDSVPFNADTTTAFEGERVSAFGRDLRSNPQYIQVTGLGPNSKIGIDTDEASADADRGVLNSESGLDFVIDPSNGSRIIAMVSDDPVIANEDIEFNISVDPDSTDDDDAPLTIAVEASLGTVGSIAWLTTL